MTTKQNLPLLPACAVLFAALGLVIFPRDTSAAARAGVTLCLDVIVPSLFPFFVLSSLAVDMGWAEALGRVAEPFTRRLFGGGCVSALVIGLVGGYPVGARCAASIYGRGGCGKEDAERALAYCNNCGPAFIFSVAGSAVCPGAGPLLFAVHILSALAVGLIFRSRGDSPPETPPRKIDAAPSFAPAFIGAVQSSFSSILNVCGFVIFFSVVIKLLTIAGILPALAAALGFLLSPLGFDAGRAARLLTGVIEMSSGVWSVAGTGDLPLLSFMLGWGGLSVHCQTLSFTGAAGLSCGKYFAGKTLHGIFAAIITSLLLRFLPSAQPSLAVAGPVFSSAAEPILTVSAVLTAAILLIFSLSLAFREKKSGNPRRKAL